LTLRYGLAPGAYHGKLSRGEEEGMGTLTDGAPWWLARGKGDAFDVEITDY